MHKPRWRGAAYLLLLAAAPSLRADEEYDRLSKDFYEARLAYYGQLRQAKPDETRPADPADAFLPKFRAYAEAHAGKPEAIPALAWILESTRPAGGTEELSADAKWALEQLMGHAADPAIRGSLGALRSGAYWWGSKPLTPLFEKIYGTNPDADTRAEALYGRGRALYEDERDPDGRDARRKDALALLHAVTKLFPDSKAAGWAGPYIFEAERLQIGMTAPDFAGEDEHGKPIRLADFRGRVVVIDFWGFW